MKHKLPDPILAPLFFIDSGWDSFSPYCPTSDATSKNHFDKNQLDIATIEIMSLNKEDLRAKEMGSYRK